MLHEYCGLNFIFLITDSNVVVVSCHLALFGWFHLRLLEEEKATLILKDSAKFIMR